MEDTLKSKVPNGAFSADEISTTYLSLTLLTVLDYGLFPIMTPHANDTLPCRVWQKGESW